MSFTREYLEANLDNPADPYGLADKDEAVLRYLAPMACGEVERFELCRRQRIKSRPA